MVFEWDEHVSHCFVKYLSSTLERFNNNISQLSFVFFRVSKLCYLQLENIISEFPLVYKIRNIFNNIEVFLKVIAYYKNEFFADILVLTRPKPQSSKTFNGGSHQSKICGLVTCCSQKSGCVLKVFPTFQEISLCSKNIFNVSRKLNVF